MIQDSFPEYDPQIAAEFSELYGNDVLGLDIPFFDGPSVLLLLMRFALNILVCWIIIHFFYYPKGKRRDYYFTLMLFGLTIFLLIFLLDNVKIQMGFALGLFAIFGMIRYRTETVPIREMTYLFMIIGISVINGLAMTVSYAELLITNGIFILGTWIMENRRILKHRAAKIILYDNINLITADKREELMADLQKRTGLNITGVEVGHIDFLRDAAFVKVFYIPNSPTEVNDIDQMTKLPIESQIRS